MREQSQPMRQYPFKRIPVRAAVLLLLLGVAGLATIAKQSQYLPSSNPLHRISKSAKMELLHPPVDFIPAQSYLVSRIVPPQPEFNSTPLARSEQPTHGEIGLRVSPQHRAPPTLLAQDDCRTRQRIFPPGSFGGPTRCKAEERSSWHGANGQM